MPTKLKKLEGIERVVTALLILVCLGVLAGAFFLQFFYSELPCPLCNLQRIGFVALIFGLLLNLKYGFHPVHYSITLLSGLFTSFVALRQIVLHIVPGTGVYGSAVFGLHLYTWSFIVSMCVVVAVCLLLSIEREYKKPPTSKNWRLIVNVLFAIAVIVIAMNAISTFLECGFLGCPDNPTTYEYL